MHSKPVYKVKLFVYLEVQKEEKEKESSLPSSRDMAAKLQE